MVGKMTLAKNGQRVLELPATYTNPKHPVTARFYYTSEGGEFLYCEEKMTRQAAEKASLGYRLKASDMVFFEILGEFGARQFAPCRKARKVVFPSQIIDAPPVELAEAA